MCPQQEWPLLHSKRVIRARKLEVNKKREEKYKKERKKKKMKQNAQQTGGGHKTPFNVTGDTNMMCLHTSDMIFKIPVKSQMI